ncbi:MAG: DNA-3-methyladenine glycosylase I [Candidatus Moranbacteria bacterium]|nr:DNA-3-methyladenine glycosylase I [Candidatus Moranbacteria bacterium]
MIQKEKRRCSWVRTGNALYEQYHDHEWGVPVFDDRTLFEFLILESAQAGLSWETILKKRQAYRKAFAGFNVKKVAAFTTHDVTRLMDDAGIVRNRLKITSAISSAKLFIAIQKEYGSFAEYAWQFVGSQPIDNKRKSLRDVPSVTKAAAAFAQAMKKRGFKFFGPTICYAFMQATGMVNDHVADCFRYQEIKKRNKKNPARG